MNDSTDGSSKAAPSAQAEPQIPEASQEAQTAVAKSDGFFSRIIGALSPTEAEQAEASQTALVQRPAHGMVNLRRLQLDDIAIPKVEITAVPVDISKDDLVEVFRESGLTRLPVFEGTLDTPIGLIHLKDLALRHGFNGNGTFDLRGMLRPLIYAPPSMPTGVLLQRMQSERIHMALVIDEYGGVDGLVTIEDLIEQVIGEIEDEHDVGEAALWTQEKEGSFLVLAKTPLDDFEEAIGQSLTKHDDIDSEDIDTLGGLVFMLSGAIPARGEIVKHPDGPEFEVIDADPRRIKRLRVRLP